MGNMTEERFEKFLHEALEDMDPVPPTPREEMWASIQRERAAQRFQRPNYRVWASWGIGLAAMLAIGIGIGRLTDKQTPAIRTAAAPESHDATPGARATAYKLAVNEYMTSADALLTAFRTEGVTRNDPQIAQQADELLARTRLLLDSPAADDPKVAALLSDLELIIAQIARLSEPSTVEHEIITDGINKTAVLPRLRATAGT
jgi:hypothetical protein